MTDYAVRRRILTKVRRSFLHKTPDNEDINADFVLHQPPDDGTVRMINPAIGLVERNGKICAGVRFLNPYIRVCNLQIQNQHNHKVVSFNIQLNDNPILPWEYYVKRLESSGDLELATWAQRIRHHHSNFPQVMAQYLAQAKSDDANIIANLRKAENQVMLVQREIESSYPYKRVTLFANGIRTIPISASYSESFLEVMGHSLESFFNTVKETGIPTLFGGECPYHINMAGAFLDCSMLQANPVKYEAECLTYLYDKNGRKRAVAVQPISLVEPSSEGLFLTAYLVIKNIDVQTNAFEMDSIKEYELKSPKRFKEDSTLENLAFSLEE